MRDRQATVAAPGAVRFPAGWLGFMLGGFVVEACGLHKRMRRNPRTGERRVHITIDFRGVDGRPLLPQMWKPKPITKAAREFLKIAENL